MKFKITLTATMLALTSWTIVAIGQTPPTTANKSSAVAATVNGQAIAESELERAVKATEGWAKLPAKEQADQRKETLEILINNMLIEQFLVAQKIPVDSKEIQAKLKQLDDDLKTRKMDYAGMLKQFGLTDEEFKLHVAAEIRWEKYRDGKLPDKELRSFFESNKVMFDGTQVRARHILLTPDVKDPKEVEKAKAKLAAIKTQVAADAEVSVGKLPPDSDKLTKDQARAAALEDAFAKAAEANSVCPTKSIGGDLDWFPRICRLDDKVVQTAFGLKPFTMSDVITTDFGQHLIMTTGRKDGQPVQFEKVRDYVRDECEGRLRESLLKQLRQTAKITIAPQKD